MTFWAGKRENDRGHTALAPHHPDLDLDDIVAVAGFVAAANALGAEPHRLSVFGLRVLPAALDDPDVRGYPENLARIPAARGALPEADSLPELHDAREGGVRFVSRVDGAAFAPPTAPSLSRTAC